MFSAFFYNFFATLLRFSFRLLRECVSRQAFVGVGICTGMGKQKRNSISGVSNSIKSKIWIKFGLCSVPVLSSPVQSSPVQSMFSSFSRSGAVLIVPGVGEGMKMLEFRP